MADQVGKEVALAPGDLVKVLHLKETGRRRRGHKAQYSDRDRKAITELKLHQGDGGRWLTLDGRQFLNKPLARKVLTKLHEYTHWDVQGLCDHFLRANLCLGVYGFTKAITKGCVICQKVNQKVMRKTEPGARELAQRPFQTIQVNFTRMPSLQGYRHLLVIVDHLTHWVEAFPTKKETAQVVVKIMLENNPMV